MPTSCIYVVEITEITRALIHNGCMLLRLLTKYVLIVTKGGYFFHLCVCECVCACKYTSTATALLITLGVEYLGIACAFERMHNVKTLTCAFHTCLSALCGFTS